MRPPGLFSGTIQRSPKGGVSLAARLCRSGNWLNQLESLTKWSRTRVPPCSQALNVWVCIATFGTVNQRRPATPVSRGMTATCVWRWLSQCQSGAPDRTLSQSQTIGQMTKAMKFRLTRKSCTMLQ